MNKIIGVVAAIIIIVGGYLWYEHAQSAMTATGTNATSTIVSASSTTAASSTPDTFGTYSYECDEHVSFTMTPSSDMGSIAIAPNGANATYPPAVTLYKEPAPAGVRYVGSGILFTGQGESVTLGDGTSTINCSPVQDPDMAPFNFGD